MPDMDWRSKATGEIGDTTYRHLEKRINGLFPGTYWLQRGGTRGIVGLRVYPVQADNNIMPGCFLEHLISESYLTDLVMQMPDEAAYNARLQFILSPTVARLQELVEQP